MSDDREPKAPGAGPASSGPKAFPASEFAGIGLQFAIIVVVFVMLGLWLDRRLDTSPWLLLACLVVGAGGGMYSMYRRAMAANRGHGRDG